MDWKFENRSATTDSLRSTLLENNTVPLLNFLSDYLYCGYVSDES